MQMRQRLSQVFHETDYLIRWGGEEFLIVARATDRSHAEALAEQIRLAVAGEDFPLDDDRSLNKTCSVGFACFPFLTEHPRTLAWLEVVEVADMALYIAKRSGRNAWVGLSAGADAQPDGLMLRIRREPLSSIRDCDLVLTSSLSAACLEEALETLGK
jgi:diguanylate cyclase (GGDEF)-like protein